MASPAQVHEVVPQIATKGIELFSVLADGRQKVVREMVNFSVVTEKEAVRLCAEFQLAAVEAMKDAQSFWFRRQADIWDTARNPLTWYYRNLSDTVESTQTAVKLFESAAQAMSRSTERVQASAEQTAKEIQAAFAHVSDEVKALYASASQQAKVRGHKAEAA